MTTSLTTKVIKSLFFCTVLVGLCFYKYSSLFEKVFVKVVILDFKDASKVKDYGYVLVQDPLFNEPWAYKTSYTNYQRWQKGWRLTLMASLFDRDQANSHVLSLYRLIIEYSLIILLILWWFFYYQDQQAYGRRLLQAQWDQNILALKQDEARQKDRGQVQPHKPTPDFWRYAQDNPN